MDDKIDWKKVRERNAQYVPVAVPARKPGRRQLKKGTPEYIEFRKKEAQRAREYYRTHREAVRRRQAQWEKENPEKVKAKKHRFYEAHKAEIRETRRRREKADPERYKQLKHESYVRCRQRRLGLGA